MHKTTVHYKAEIKEHEEIRQTNNRENETLQSKQAFYPITTYLHSFEKHWGFKIKSKPYKDMHFTVNPFPCN